MTIRQHKIKALRHGMAGQAGYELFGPWELGTEIKTALLETGREFGIRHVGLRAYPSATLESGWIPSIVPAVYTGDGLALCHQSAHLPRPTLS
jgi:glycine cleavage system aminomethyltransferase T